MLQILRLTSTLTTIPILNKKLEDRLCRTSGIDFELYFHNLKFSFFFYQSLLFISLLESSKRHISDMLNVKKVECINTGKLVG